LRSLNRNNTIIKKFIFLIFLFFGLINAVKNPKTSKEIIAPKTVVLDSNNPLSILFLQKNFVGFKEALAFKESQGKYSAVNTLGYLGKYQFGKYTIAYCKVNRWILRRDIKRSVGKTINGIKITESGILAAAHLSGAGNVKKYLRSNGSRNLSDAYGTSIASYMKNFAGYDVSFIVGDRKASV